MTDIPNQPFKRGPGRPRKVRPESAPQPQPTETVPAEPVAEPAPPGSAPVVRRLRHALARLPHNIQLDIEIPTNATGLIGQKVLQQLIGVTLHNALCRLYKYRPKMVLPIETAIVPPKVKGGFPVLRMRFQGTTSMGKHTMRCGPEFSAAIGRVDEEIRAAYKDNTEAK